MKKLLIGIAAVLLLMGCENFLNTENLTKKDNTNFPMTEEDAQLALTAVYSSLREVTPGEEDMTFFVVSEILSDDRFGGGGPDDSRIHAIDRLKKVEDNMCSDVWKQRYKGIYRANMLLQSLDAIQWEDEAVRETIEGEVRFLRAYFYFDLCRMYGTVPLITVTEAVNLPKAKPEELYALIGSDLKRAVALLPAKPYSPAENAGLGHATKWAAEALLSRVFLFYTGYYQTEALPAEDGEIGKSEVIGYIDDCIDNSGHALLPDFRSLWPYSNEYTKSDYPYMQNTEAVWAGENGDNVETIFSIRYSPKANWGMPYLSNRACLYFSMREPESLESVFPVGTGWGFGTVNPKLWEEWPAGDLRREASILNVEKELPDYEWGRDKQMNETGYWQKKYLAINAYSEEGIVNFYKIDYPGVNSDYQLNNMQDQVILRFADVLLMAAELKKDAGPLNRVRVRAGLGEVAYSEENLRNERRWELAFEGCRYYDLLRWGLAEEALQAQDGVKVKDNMIDTQMNMSDIAERIRITGGFLPVPQSQISLSAGVLEQNPGWGNESNMN